jgi:hypothetical protein
LDFRHGIELFFKRRLHFEDGRPLSFDQFLRLHVVVGNVTADGLDFDKTAA